MSIFDVFRNSSMPKRLLRYALSRFDVLDADALNLDNLDLAWGRNTVLEFRDVGLRVEKLQHILQLPPTFHIRRAKVTHLRVSLPVDIYSSPIQIQVTGVDVRLRVARDDDRPPARRRGSKAPPLGDDADDAVPTAVDLAQSFLQQEPSGEAAALEAALASASSEQQHLGASTPSLDQSTELDSDDDTTSSSSEVLGTGQALTLPAFLADFLQGIIDRIQVNIEGVTFQLEIDVPVADDTPAETLTNTRTTGSETVIFELALARIHVEGVTTTTAAPTSPTTDDARPKIVPKEGKRHITLDNVRAFLISEANVFSALARSPSMPSSTSSSQSPVPARIPISRFPSAPASVLAVDPLANSMTSSMNDSMAASSILAQSHYALQDSEDAFNIPYEDSEGGSGDDHENAGREEAAEALPAASPLSTPRASIYSDMPSIESPPPGTSARFVQSAIVSCDRSALFQDAQDADQFEAKSEPAPARFLGAARSASNIRGFPVGLGLGLSRGALVDHFHPSLPARHDETAEYPGVSESIDGNDDDDLSQSHMYSHEEAESMYLSAFSQAPSVQLHHAMPGGWHVDENADSRVLGPVVEDNAPAVPSIQEVPPVEVTEAEAEAEVPSALPDRAPKAAFPVISETEADQNTEASPSTPQIVAADTTSPIPDAVAQPDEAATPKGPARLVKEILSLEYISIYVPSQHKHVVIPEATPTPTPTKLPREQLDKSMAPQLPGAFSIYSTAGMASTYGAASTQGHLGDSRLEPHEHSDAPANDESVEVNLAPLEISFDASIGFLLAKVVSELLQSLKSGLALQKKRRTSSAPGASAPSTLLDIKFHGSKISLLFLDKLAGVADTAERLFESPKSSVKNLGQSRDVLLQINLENLAVGVSQKPGPAASTVTKTMVDLQRFRFRYADADIVSFDRRIQMRASVRDAFPPSGDDVSVKVVQSAEATKCEVSTLPLLFSLDLQRIDETFSWFGGLSSFLSMGSSISSAASQGSRAVTPKAKPSPPPGSRPRGVRFETPIRPDDRSAAAENKVDMRIGGVHLELIGRDCSVALDTSAVKLVSREEGIGVGVSRIRLTGPYLRNSRGGGPPVTAEVTNTRLEFLNVPKDKDLERLLELITPSKVKFDEREDVIMVDTLLRQRRSGPLLRLHVDDVRVQAHNLAQLSCLPSLGEEVARLATVAKYLPEDDRPGLLTLGLVRRVDVSADLGGRVGTVQALLADVEVAHITMPSLVAAAVGTISVHRNQTETLVGSSSVPAMGVATAATAAATAAATPSVGLSPALMLRIIGDDMEPVIKVKMWGLNFEYRVPTIMDVLGLAEDATPQDFEASLALSVANLGEQAQSVILSGRADKSGPAERATTAAAKPTTVDVSFRDCVLGLNPLGLSSKLDVVLVDARLEVMLPQGEEVDAVAHLNKMSLLLIDVVPVEGAAADKAGSGGPGKDIVRRLCGQGFVDICQISSAKVSVHVSPPNEGGERMMDLEVRDDLLVLETCADSTQTLLGLANALKPPTPPSKEIKFQTEVMPVKDLLASISIDAFGRAEGNYDFDEDFVLEEGADDGAGGDDDYYSGDLGGMASSLGLSDRDRAAEQSVASLPSLPDVTEDDLLDDDVVDMEGLSGTVAEKLFSASSVLSEGTARSVNEHDRDLHDDFGHDSHESTNVRPNAEPVEDIGFDDGFFGTATETAAESASPAHRWSSVQNGYDKGDGVAARAPLRLRVRDVHVIWNLFDGYDWQHTRDVIAQTVQEVEARAYERRTRRRRRSGHEFSPYADEEEEDAVIGDFLFNSIYIGIPTNHDPRELAQAITQEIYGGGGDTVGETESVAATTVTATSSRLAAGGGGGGVGGPHGSSRSGRRLKLQRSRRHKITFELGGVSADVVVFPPDSGETQTSVDVRVRDLDVFDHVPTSTWKKFATYDRDAGERPIDGDMVRVEVLVVKPVPELAATELVLKAAVLPLRLHVDQDALDFITRFFEFKEDGGGHGGHGGPEPATPSADQPFIQRAEILDIPVQLDFKPKRVDYAGLRSGHTTEFMNFLILDGSRMTMRHTIIYGVSGFERLGQTLNDIWMPDIKRHQLPGVLAGLAPVRSLVTVGSGFRDLIEIPIQEYRHNGRIVRSISKGAMAFARSTGTELVKLGAKVATGTQYVLQGAEGLLVAGEGEGGEGSGEGGGSGGGEAHVDDDEASERKQISLYADQPADVVAGLRHAYSSLARDLHLARDAVIAVPAEVRESTSATGAARVVMRHAPTIIFRPAIGATKAIGQTLMGATNSLDPQNLRRAEDKYKSGPGRL